mgnify:FL=1
MKKACFFLASTDKGINVETQLETIAAFLVSKNIGLVYGGGKLGLMGKISQKFIRNDGYVEGYTCDIFHNKGYTPENLNKLEVVTKFSERKQLLMDNSDFFIIFPGGLGTLDELLDILNLVSLGMSHKQVFILNIEGYWTPILDWLDTAISKGYVSRDPNNFYVCNNIEELIENIDKNVEV